MGGLAAQSSGGKHTFAHGLLAGLRLGHPGHDADVPDAGGSAPSGLTQASGWRLRVPTHPPPRRSARVYLALASRVPQQLAKQPRGAAPPERSRGAAPSVSDQELGRFPWFAFFFLRARFLLPPFAMAFLLVSAPAARPGVSAFASLGSSSKLASQHAARRRLGPWRSPTSPQVSDQVLSRGRGTSFVECTPPYVGLGRPLHRGSTHLRSSGPAS